jgi:hypothetical protein
MTAPKPSPLVLALGAAEARNAPGSLPELKATLTNRAPRPVTVCAYMLGPRLLSTLTAETADGQEYELFPFRPGRWVPVKPTDFKSIPPGKSFSVKLPLAESHVWAFVRSGQQPPIVHAGFALKGFAAGEVTFRVRLSDEMALYVGESGVYDRRWEWKKVPDELPGCPSPVPAVFRRQLKAKGAVRFG